MLSNFTSFLCLILDSSLSELTVSPLVGREGLVPCMFHSGRHNSQMGFMAEDYISFLLSRITNNLLKVQLFVYYLATQG